MAIKYKDDEQKEAAAEAGEKLCKESSDKQFKRDVEMWTAFRNKPGDSNLALMVEKLFILLYNGGLCYRPTHNAYGWTWFEKLNIPTASALSHGGRVLIQLPKASGNKVRDWLFGKLHLMARIATHGVGYLEVDQQLPSQIMKHLYETKGKGAAIAGVSVNLKDAINFGLAVKAGRDASKYVNINHRHYGLNLGLGGVGNKRLSGVENVECDGSDGHMYIHYLPPTKDQHGALLIGVEGCAPMVWDQFGHFHGAKATSSDVGPTGGGKWRNLGVGPIDAEDDLFINLTAEIFHNCKDVYTFSEDLLKHPPLTGEGNTLSNDLTFIPRAENLKDFFKKAIKKEKLTVPTHITDLIDTYSTQKTGIGKVETLLSLINYLGKWKNTLEKKEKLTLLGVNQLIQCVKIELQTVEWRIKSKKE